MEDVKVNFPVLCFDKRRFQQVLKNLLANAIKFTEKGTITIAADVKRAGHFDEGFVLTVSVEDEGIGMS